MSFERSDGKHHSSGIGCFVNQALATEETNGYYYGPLAYKNMYAYGGKQYGERVMAVSSLLFKDPLLS